ncbi:MAG: aconitate hydratase [Candidatus Micrarchaeia archaeon]|jgi:aconitate hydratase
MARGTVFQKVLSAHVGEGGSLPVAGNEVAVKIDHALLQDATGTMAALEFESLGISRVKTEKAAVFVDHNTLQTGFENADDHRFLRTFSQKYGLYFSPPGNGICHQVFLERLAVPGKTLIGSDSHTPTAGGLGAIAIGAGGLDVAAAMAGLPYHIQMPKVIGVKLVGQLQGWASAKDVILELLRRLSVKGGVGKAFEYFGDGVATLSVPERATITNMGAELGATTSIFPSDARTLEFLQWQAREKDFVEISAEKNAEYDEIIEINLSALEPLVALPHLPDKVVAAKEASGTKLDQVLIGSCTNSSLADLETAASILSTGRASASISVGISPGSAGVLSAITQSGDLAKLIGSGARVLECACGPCIGMGQAPCSKGNSLRTFNRNFEGRSGTKDASIFLSGVEVACASALKGEIANPDDVLGERPTTGSLARVPSSKLKEFYAIARQYDLMFAPLSAGEGAKIEVLRGPNIASLPALAAFPETLSAQILLKTGDNITTDHIMPAGAKILPLRSNINKISEHVFEQVDATFAKRAGELRDSKGSGAIVGGENYGQGSSREHAALAPAFLGIRLVVAKSFARIHKSNLVNFGILPLEFSNPQDFDKAIQGGTIALGKDAYDAVKNGAENVPATLGGTKIMLKCSLNAREREMVLAGGLLNLAKLGGGVGKNGD